MNTERATTHARQEVEKFVVRLPKGMRSKIAEVSRLSHRSMNSEIIARLEESLGHASEDNSNTPSAPLLRSVDNNAGDQEHTLLAHFRAMSTEKRAALLELIG